MTRKTFSILFAALLAAGGAAGCRDRSSAADTQPSDAEEVDRINPRGAEPPEVIFPAALRTDDESLNRFIDSVLGFCVKGEYGSYRLAVGSQYEPLPRKNFERAWRAVKEVRIRKILRVYEPTTRAADPSRTDVREELKHPIYCVHGTITLRDTQRTRPVREVVVLLIKEHGEWRLGPPAPLAVKHRIMGMEAPAGDLVSPVTHDEEPSSRPTTTRAAE
jgi:hypothetical protein